jgi:glycosyltransferase involved in cell wall biosynthesis
MTQLSVVIITYNEERNIGRCLDSVKEIADDIVIVDSFSTDRTEQICIEKGARFIKHTFEGHIEQKNWAITQARYPYILSLDADEALDEKLKQEIIKVKEKWEQDGYILNRLTNYCGHWIRHSGWHPDHKLRMFDSRKGKWGGLNPHDTYVLDDKKNVAFLEGKLLHYSFYTIYQHIQQINSFSDISSKALHEKGERVNLFMILLNPIAKFIRNYFIHKGFLDGYYGFVICAISAHATFLKYVKLRSYTK